MFLHDVESGRLLDFLKVHLEGRVIIGFLEEMELEKMLEEEVTMSGDEINKYQNFDE